MKAKELIKILEQYPDRDVVIEIMDQEYELVDDAVCAKLDWTIDPGKTEILNITDYMQNTMSVPYSVSLPKHDQRWAIVLTRGEEI